MIMFFVHIQLQYLRNVILPLAIDVYLQRILLEYLYSVSVLFFYISLNTF